MGRLRIESAAFGEQQDLIYGIRRTVFILEQSVPEEIEMDSLDPTARHVVAYLDDRPVGTGRITAEGRIGRMAVLVEHRNRGVGQAILKRLMEIGREIGVPKFILSAQCHAIPFYERMGFEVCSPVFQEADIDHQEMERPVDAW